MSYHSKKLLYFMAAGIFYHQISAAVHDQAASNINFVADSISHIVSSSMHQIKTPGVPAVILGTIQLIKWLLEKRQTKLQSLDFTKDISNVPYKKFLLNTQEEISTLIDQSVNGSFEEQVAARILLFDITVPEPYTKHFHEGLEKLYPHCFYKNGDFHFSTTLPKMKSLFKKWYKKTPQTWQKIAAIPERKYKKFLSTWMQKPESPFHRSQQAYDILKAIQYGRSFQFIKLALLRKQYPQDKTMQKIEAIFLQKFHATNKSNTHYFTQAKHDPLASMSNNSNISIDFLHLMVLRWCAFSCVKQMIAADIEMHQDSKESIYNSIPSDSLDTILNENYPIHLLINFLKTNCFGAHAHTHQLFASSGILHTYIKDPLVKAYSLDTKLMHNVDVQICINAGLAISEHYKYHARIKSACYTMIKAACESLNATNQLDAEIHLQTAKKILHALPHFTASRSIHTTSKIDDIPELYQAAYAIDVQNNHAKDLCTFSLSFALQTFLQDHCISKLNFQHFQATQTQKAMCQDILNLLEKAYDLSQHESLAHFQFSIDNLCQIINTAQLCVLENRLKRAVELMQYAQDIIDLMHTYTNTAVKKSFVSFASTTNTTPSWSYFNMYKIDQCASIKALKQNISKEIRQTQSTDIVQHKINEIAYKTCQIAEIQYQIQHQARRWYKKLPLIHQPTIFETSFEGMILQHHIEKNVSNES